MSENLTVRIATIALVENLDDPASSLAMAFVIAGHEIHQMNLVREK